MKSRRYGAWHKLVALAPLALLLAYLPGQMMLRCRLDGRLRPACCCPAQDPDQSSGPVIKAQDCCDREVTVSARPVVEPPRAAGSDRDPTALVQAPFAFAQLTSPPASRHERARQGHGPPREGPPIVLLKHAFLI